MTSYGSEISKRNQPTQANTTGNARFANSLELLAKTPTLLAKALRQQLRAVGEDSNPVGEGFTNRVSEFLLGKNRWRFK
jgi:hypothetical protein